MAVRSLEASSSAVSKRAAASSTSLRLIGASGDGTLELRLDDRREADFLAGGMCAGLLLVVKSSFAFDRITCVGWASLCMGGRRMQPDAPVVPVYIPHMGAGWGKARAGCAPAAVLAALAFAVPLIGAPPASALTYGADLSQPVVNAAQCGELGQNSCMAFSSSPYSYAPASGTITAVRVKTGDVPQGEMQVEVLRSYYQNNPSDPGHPNFYCCFLQEYGPTFVPARNAITTVPTALGVVEDPTPPADDGNTVAKGDFLALSIFGGSSYVPLSANSNGTTTYYAPAPSGPAPSSNGLPGGAGAVFGYELMMNADLTPLGGGGGTGGGPPSPVVKPQVSVNTHAGRFTGNTAEVPLGCHQSARCIGALALRDSRPAIAVANHHASSLLGSARFSIRAHRVATVKVRLNSTGRRYIRHKRHVVVYAVATVNGRSLIVKLTLKLLSKHH